MAIMGDSRALRQIHVMGFRALMILLAFAAPAQAGLLKCKAADGSVTYTDTSCPPGTSNQDVSPEISAPASSTPSAGNSDKPLSTAALVFKHKIERCLQSQAQADCRPLDVTAEICNDKQGSKSAQCAPFWEAVEASRSLALGIDPRSVSSLRAACASGSQSACVQAACPPNVYNEGSDEQLRACAHQRRMGTSTHWIQSDEHRNGQSSSTNFTCMKKQEKVMSWGAKRTFRPQVIVISQVQPGGMRAVHKANNLPDEEFATAGEAATAGCAAEARKFEQQNQKEERKPAGKKPSSTV